MPILNSPPAIVEINSVLYRQVRLCIDIVTPDDFRGNGGWNETSIDRPAIRLKYRTSVATRLRVIKTRPAVSEKPGLPANPPGSNNNVPHRYRKIKTKLRPLAVQLFNTAQAD